MTRPDTERESMTGPVEKVRRKGSAIALPRKSLRPLAIVSVYVVFSSSLAFDRIKSSSPSTSSLSLFSSGGEIVTALRGTEVAIHSSNCRWIFSSGVTLTAPGAGNTPETRGGYLSSGPPCGAMDVAQPMTNRRKKKNVHPRNFISAHQFPIRWITFPIRE